MELNEWLSRITSGDSTNEIAAKSGVPSRTLHHQISNSRMSLENKIAISVAYGHHPLRTLIEWDFVDAAWEQVPDIDAAIRIATEEQLADEVLRRMRIGIDSDEFVTPIDQLAERREKNSNKPEQPVSSDGYDPLKHAGYSGPDEDAMRGYGEEDNDHIP